MGRDLSHWKHRDGHSVRAQVERGTLRASGSLPDSFLSVQAVETKQQVWASGDSHPRGQPTAGEESRRDTGQPAQHTLTLVCQGKRVPRSYLTCISTVTN